MSMNTRVRDYLARHYDVTPDEVAAALRSEAAQDHIASAERMRSEPYYPADLIASANDWVELDVDEEDDG